MAIRLFNTLSLKKEEFIPLEDGKVGMYSCGPTVYNYAHIGNLRSFVFVDIFKRYMKYRGYQVKHVMNITDVDDKTIRDSKKEGKTLKDFTEFYTKEFFDDFRSLGIQMPDVIPHATGTIKEMVDLIKKLLDKGIAYKGSDGTVYYDIGKFKDYGKLSHTRIEGLKAGARVCHDEYSKENASDFALWKAWDDDDGEVFWDTELGKGRPGWHIECSAMSMKELGETFDIHTGGVDLIFPHHENEIAQSEAATGKQFVKYWVHCEHLIFDGKKMSKSEGNFYTLRDLLKKGLDPLAIRYTLLSTHYRQQLNFTLESVQASAKSLERINDFIELMRSISKNDGAESVREEAEKIVKAAKSGFAENMDDNLNISGALASIFEMVKGLNRLASEEKLGKAGAQKAIEAMEGFDSVLGILSRERKSLDSEVQELIDERDAARKGRDFAKADRIRDELKEKGIILEDTRHGVRWKRA